MLVAMALAGMLVASPATEDDNWVTSRSWGWEDTAIEAGVQASLLADWALTLDATRHPDLWEQNPVLGHRPSRSAINTYFAASMLTHAVVAAVLPRHARLTWQGLTLAVQVHAISRNVGLGLSVGGAF